MGNGTQAFAVAAEQPEKANPLKHVEDMIEQRFKLSALRRLTCDLIREKELIYRNVKKGAKLIQHLQTWVLPLIFYGNKVAGS